MPIRPVAPVFIFWGRIHAQKGLKRALKIFLGIVEVRPDARFIVIGPDCGDLSCFSSIVRQLGIESNVSFEGALEFSEIRKRAEQASFYLQTSELEGMAMSVVEAMQLGLVPVVTPVGEIKHYACHKKNALVVLDDRTAVYDVLEMLSEPARYLTCRQNAIATWATKPLYRDDVLRACIEALRLS
jgi:glycosyltransferase involved in cell wall biosynthesis